MKIEIHTLENGGFDVHTDDGRTTGQLTIGEMLEVVTGLTVAERKEDRRCLRNWLQTPEHRQEMERRREEARRAIENSRMQS